MTYRDDRDALLARVSALEAENRQLRAELEALRNPPPPTPPPPPAAGRQLSFRIREPAGERVVTLSDDVIKVGRHTTAHVRLTDASVSRLHAVIERTNDGPVIIDLGSSTGTLVNGTRINKATLAHGDVIALGNVTLVVGAGE